MIRGYESPFGSPRVNFSSEFHTFHSKFYCIGRFNEEFLSKITLMEQSKSETGSHRNIILIPGISVCYTNLNDAQMILQQ